MTKRKLDVERWTTSSIRDRYDLAIGTLGYEQRARHFWEKFNPTATRRVVMGFTEHQVLSFQDNLAYYQGAEFQILPSEDSGFRSELEALEAALPERDVYIIVDISSLSRTRIGQIGEWLFERMRDRSVHVDFVYTMAAFQPGGEPTKQNSYAGPITPTFAGWWRYPELPVAAVIGVGRQQYKALGAVELLQVPDSIWTFLPISIEEQYGKELERSNKELFHRVPVSQRINYTVNDPFATFTILRSLVETLSHSYNVVLLPFGPKIFSLLAILIPLTGINSAVWRISAGTQQEPREAFAREDEVGLRVTFHQINSQ